ncbi:hypothetical protein NC653_017994 [Populus alba x Populus x berolinensis]|uniref:Uncharacterized protein n=1 Tax=Populus alba x Populus x berolinensis TaxID=444605 RepID=A0AAD6W178_9ROSI|nr:hypothetical protein NC653_017994 [Populus alba x Populus x berolinensis]
MEYTRTTILTSGLAALHIRTYACQDSYQGSGHFKSDIELIKCNFSPLIDAHHPPLLRDSVVIDTLLWCHFTFFISISQG